MLKYWSSDVRFTLELRLMTKMWSSAKPTSKPIDVRLIWSSHLKLHNIKISLSVEIRREAQWNPCQTLEARGSHEVRIWTPPLRKFSKCWDQKQGSVKPAFNRQTQVHTDKAKTRRSSNPRLAYQCKSRIWNQTQAWASHWRFNSEEA